MKIRIEAIYLSPGHDFYNRRGKGRLYHGIESPASVDCVAGKGLRGDRFFDYKEKFKGQVTFFAGEVADALRERAADPHFENSAFRRNILIRGVDLNSLLGKTFRIGGIAFEATEQAAPCDWMDVAVGEGTRDFLQGRGGIRARVLSSGQLKVGKTELHVGKDSRPLSRRNP